MNKNNKFIFIFLFILTHIFVFYFFIFFLGWAQFSPWGLGWTQPARPGHWPKPVTRLGKNQRKHA
jgi:hypothetical protein